MLCVILAVRISKHSAALGDGCYEFWILIAQKFIEIYTGTVPTKIFFQKYSIWIRFSLLLVSATF